MVLKVKHAKNQNQINHNTSFCSCMLQDYQSFTNTAKRKNIIILIIVKGAVAL